MNKDDIYKFDKFVNVNENSVVKFLTKKAETIKSKKLPHMVNDFIKCKEDERPECIEDILLEIGDCVDGEEFNWVKNSLENMELNKKVKLSNDKREH